MIRLTLTESDIGATHLSVSPLWETTGALLLLRSGHGWPYNDWAEQASEALEHVDRAALRIFEHQARVSGTFERF